MAPRFAPAPLITGFVLLGSLVLGGAAGGARQQTTPPQFRAAADLVPVDVSVLDRDRRPVRGLTAADFTVTEDGKPQPIVAFSEVALPERETGGAPWLRETSPDIRRNDEASDHRLIALVIDDALIPQMLPAMVSSTREIARGVVDRLGPDDLAAVVFTQDGRRAQDFTHDRARLLAAIDSFTGGFHEPLNMLAPDKGIRDAEKARGFVSLNAVQQLVDVLATMPDRRKAVVWIGVGMSANVDDVIGPDVSAELGRHMRELLRRADLAHVNVYAVDPGGLDGLLNYLNGEAAKSRYAIEAQRLRAQSDELSRLFRDSLRMLADNTGGHAFINTNEFKTGVTQILRETGTFYLLGYKPPNPKADGRFRRIQVRVNKPGLTVNTRRGYYAPEPPRPGATPPPPPAVAAIAGLLPKSDVTLQVSAAPFAIPGQRDAAVAILLGLRAPDSAARAAGDRVSLLINAYTAEGQSRGSASLVADVALGAGARSADVDYEVLGQLRLPPGRYELRLAADGTLLGRSGSVYYDVEVPDFQSATLALSGLVLAVDPAVPVAPKDRFLAILPIVPTVRRMFATTDRVTAFVRLSQGGNAPLGAATVTTQILDRAGATVFDVARTFGPEQFGPARTADYQFDVPVARLSPGPYLLTVKAQVGTAAVRRDLQFSLR
jgi:VWFA-related protein